MLCVLPVSAVGLIQFIMCLYEFQYTIFKAKSEEINHEVLFLKSTFSMSLHFLCCFHLFPLICQVHYFLGLVQFSELNSPLMQCIYTWMWSSWPSAFGPRLVCRIPHILVWSVPESPSRRFWRRMFSENPTDWPNVIKVRLHLRFCTLRLTSWSMCLTDDSVEVKLEPIISWFLALWAAVEFISYTRMTIAP